MASISDSLWCNKPEMPAVYENGNFFYVIEDSRDSFEQKDKGFDGRTEELIDLTMTDDDDEVLETSIGSTPTSSAVKCESSCFPQTNQPLSWTPALPVIEGPWTVKQQKTPGITDYDGSAASRIWTPAMPVIEGPWTDEHDEGDYPQWTMHHTSPKVGGISSTPRSHKKRNLTQGIESNWNVSPLLSSNTQNTNYANRDNIAPHPANSSRQKIPVNLRPEVKTATVQKQHLTKQNRCKAAGQKLSHDEGVCHVTSCGVQPKKQTLATEPELHDKNDVISNLQNWTFKLKELLITKTSPHNAEIHVDLCDSDIEEISSENDVVEHRQAIKSAQRKHSAVGCSVKTKPTQLSKLSKAPLEVVTVSPEDTTEGQGSMKALTWLSHERTLPPMLFNRKDIGHSSADQHPKTAVSTTKAYGLPNKKKLSLIPSKLSLPKQTSREKYVSSQVDRDKSTSSEMPITHNSMSTSSDTVTVSTKSQKATGQVLSKQSNVTLVPHSTTSRMASLERHESTCATIPLNRTDHTFTAKKGPTKFTEVQPMTKMQDGTCSSFTSKTHSCTSPASRVIPSSSDIETNDRSKHSGTLPCNIFSVPKIQCTKLKTGEKIHIVQHALTSRNAGLAPARDSDPPSTTCAEDPEGTHVRPDPLALAHDKHIVRSDHEDTSSPAGQLGNQGDCSCVTDDRSRSVHLSEKMSTAVSELKLSEGISSDIISNVSGRPRNKLSLKKIAPSPVQNERLQVPCTQNNLYQPVNSSHPMPTAHENNMQLETYISPVPSSKSHTPLLMALLDQTPTSAVTASVSERAEPADVAATTTSKEIPSSVEKCSHSCGLSPFVDTRGELLPQSSHVTQTPSTIISDGLAPNTSSALEGPESDSVKCRMVSIVGRFPNPEGRSVLKTLRCPSAKCTTLSQTSLMSDAVMSKTSSSTNESTLGIYSYAGRIAQHEPVPVTVKTMPSTPVTTFAGAQRLKATGSVPVRLTSSAHAKIKKRPKVKTAPKHAQRHSPVRVILARPRLPQAACIINQILMPPPQIVKMSTLGPRQQTAPRGERRGRPSKYSKLCKALNPSTPPSMKEYKLKMFSQSNTCNMYNAVCNTRMRSQESVPTSRTPSEMIVISTKMTNDSSRIVPSTTEVSKPKTNVQTPEWCSSITDMMQVTNFSSQTTKIWTHDAKMSTPEGAASLQHVQPTSGSASVTSSLPPISTMLSPISQKLPPVTSLLNISSPGNSVGPFGTAPCIVNQKFCSSVTNALAAETNVLPMEANVSLIEASISPIEANVSPVEANISPIEANVSLIEASVSPIEANISPIEANVSPIEANICLREADVSRAKANVSLMVANVTPAEANVALTKHDSFTAGASVLPSATGVFPAESNVLQTETNASSLATSSMPLVDLGKYHQASINALPQLDMIRSMSGTAMVDSSNDPILLPQTNIFPTLASRLQSGLDVPSQAKDLSLAIANNSPILTGTPGSSRTVPGPSINNTMQVLPRSYPALQTENSCFGRPLLDIHSSVNVQSVLPNSALSSYLVNGPYLPTVPSNTVPLAASTSPMLIPVGPIPVWSAHPHLLGSSLSHIHFTDPYAWSVIARGIGSQPSQVIISQVGRINEPRNHQGHNMQLQSLTPFFQHGGAIFPKRHGLRIKEIPSRATNNPRHDAEEQKANSMVLSGATVVTDSNVPVLVAENIPVVINVNANSNSDTSVSNINQPCMGALSLWEEPPCVCDPHKYTQNRTEDSLAKKDNLVPILTMASQEGEKGDGRREIQAIEVLISSENDRALSKKAPRTPILAVPEIKQFSGQNTRSNMTSAEVHYPSTSILPPSQSNMDPISDLLSTVQRKQLSSVIVDLMKAELDVLNDTETQSGNTDSSRTDPNKDPLPPTASTEQHSGNYDAIFSSTPVVHRPGKTRGRRLLMSGMPCMPSLKVVGEGSMLKKDTTATGKSMEVPWNITKIDLDQSADFDDSDDEATETPHNFIKDEGKHVNKAEKQSKQGSDYHLHSIDLPTTSDDDFSPPKQITSCNPETGTGLIPDKHSTIGQESHVTVSLAGIYPILSKTQSRNYFPHLQNEVHAILNPKSSHKLQPRAAESCGSLGNVESTSCEEQRLEQTSEPRMVQCKTSKITETDAKNTCDVCNTSLLEKYGFVATCPLCGKVNCRMSVKSLEHKSQADWTLDDSTTANMKKSNRVMDSTTANMRKSNRVMDLESKREVEALKSLQDYRLHTARIKPKTVGTSRMPQEELQASKNAAEHSITERGQKAVCIERPCAAEGQSKPRGRPRGRPAIDPLKEKVPPRKRGRPKGSRNKANVSVTSQAATVVHHEHSMRCCALKTNQDLVGLETSNDQRKETLSAERNANEGDVSTSEKSLNSPSHCDARTPSRRWRPGSCISTKVKGARWMSVRLRNLKSIDKGTRKTNAERKLDHFLEESIGLFGPHYVSPPKCTICFRRFRNDAVLERHVTSHECDMLRKCTGTTVPQATPVSRRVHSNVSSSLTARKRLIGKSVGIANRVGLRVRLDLRSPRHVQKKVQGSTEDFDKTSPGTVAGSPIKTNGKMSKDSEDRDSSITRQLTKKSSHKKHKQCLPPTPIVTRSASKIYSLRKLPCRRANQSNMRYVDPDESYTVRHAAGDAGNKHTTDGKKRKSPNARKILPCEGKNKEKSSKTTEAVSHKRKTTGKDISPTSSKAVLCKGKTNLAKEKSPKNTQMLTNKGKTTSGKKESSPNVVKSKIITNKEISSQKGNKSKLTPKSSKSKVLPKNDCNIKNKSPKSKTLGAQSNNKRSSPSNSSCVTSKKSKISGQKSMSTEKKVSPEKKSWNTCGSKRKRTSSESSKHQALCKKRKTGAGSIGKHRQLNKRAKEMTSDDEAGAGLSESNASSDEEWEVPDCSEKNKTRHQCPNGTSVGSDFEDCLMADLSMSSESDYPEGELTIDLGSESPHAPEEIKVTVKSTEKTDKKKASLGTSNIFDALNDLERTNAVAMHQLKPNRKRTHSDTGVSEERAAKVKRHSLIPKSHSAAGTSSTSGGTTAPARSKGMGSVAPARTVKLVPAPSFAGRNLQQLQKGYAASQSIQHPRGLSGVRPGTENDHKHCGSFTGLRPDKQNGGRAAAFPGSTSDGSRQNVPQSSTNIRPCPRASFNVMSSNSQNRKDMEPMSCDLCQRTYPGKNAYEAHCIRGQHRRLERARQIGMETSGRAQNQDRAHAIGSLPYIDHVGYSSGLQIGCPISEGPLSPAVNAAAEQGLSGSLNQTGGPANSKLPFSWEIFMQMMVFMKQFSVKNDSGQNHMQGDLDDRYSSVPDNPLFSEAGMNTAGVASGSQDTSSRHDSSANQGSFPVNYCNTLRKNTPTSSPAGLSWLQNVSGRQQLDSVGSAITDPGQSKDSKTDPESLIYLNDLAFDALDQALPDELLAYANEDFGRETYTTSASRPLKSEQDATDDRGGRKEPDSEAVSYPGHKQQWYSEVLQSLDIIDSQSYDGCMADSTSGTAAVEQQRSIPNQQLQHDASKLSANDNARQISRGMPTTPSSEPAVLSAGPNMGREEHTLLPLEMTPTAQTRATGPSHTLASTSNSGENFRHSASNPIRFSDDNCKNANTRGIGPGVQERSANMSTQSAHPSQGGIVSDATAVESTTTKHGAYLGKAAKKASYGFGQMTHFTSPPPRPVAPKQQGRQSSCLNTPGLLWSTPSQDQSYLGLLNESLGDIWEGNISDISGIEGPLSALTACEADKANVNVSKNNEDSAGSRHEKKYIFETCADIANNHLSAGDSTESSTKTTASKESDATSRQKETAHEAHTRSPADETGTIAQPPTDAARTVQDAAVLCPQEPVPTKDSME